MDVVVSNEIWEVKIDKENQVLYQCWHEKSQDMKDAEFREMMEFIVSIIVDNDIYASIADTKNFRFFISASTNKWLNESLAPKYLGSSYSKMAIVVSTDFWTQLSIEDAIENKDEGLFDTSFFTNTEDAEKWINQYRRESVHA